MNDDRAGRRLPIIHRITDEENGPFQRQHLDLEFSNGERRRFERLVSRGHGAVVVVPMLDDETVLLVREYAAGMHRYELGLVKGRIDAGETPEQAADRDATQRRMAAKDLVDARISAAQVAVSQTNAKTSQYQAAIAARAPGISRSCSQVSSRVISRPVANARDAAAR